MLGTEFDINADSSLEGILHALVVSNEDPKGQERLLIRVMGVHNLNNDTVENAVWANHCAPTRSASGDLPIKDDWVYVMFPNKKDPMYIIWLGYVRSSFQSETTPDTAIPEEPDVNEIG